MSTGRVSDSASQTFDDLLRLARSGSIASLSSLLKRCTADLFQTASIRLDAIPTPPITLDDLVEATLREAEEAFGSSTCQTESEFRDWLMEILSTHLNGLQQGAPVFESGDGASQIVLLDESNAYPDDQTSVREELSTEESMTTERREAIEAAVDRLPELYRNILLLHNRDGYSFDDIAARIGRTADEVRVSWARAVEMLKDILPREET